MGVTVRQHKDAQWVSPTTKGSGRPSGSRRRAGPDLIFLEARQAIVKEINRRLASETERLAFYPEPALWLLAILPNKAPHLSVIQWEERAAQQPFHTR